MNFDKSLKLALEAIPKWRKMRLARKRQTNKLISPSGAGTETGTETEPKLIQLPIETATELEKYKKSLERSLGIIIKLIPDLKPDAEQALKMLFNNVIIKFNFKETAGEGFEVLRSEWLNVLEQLNNIKNLVPMGAKYASTRKNILALTNFLRSTVGKGIMRNPSGTHPKEFDYDLPTNPYQ